MGNSDKIDIATLTNVVRNNYDNIISDNWNDINVVIKHVISLKEMLTFVDNVVKTCFSESDGMYMPEIKDFAIKKCILEIYANFELPQDVEECYDLIYTSDIIDFVIKHISRIQLNEIISSAEEKMEHLAQANIEMVNRQMNDLYTAFNNLQNQIADAYAGINKDDINNLLNAISNSHIDEDKIVKAVLKEHRSNNETASVTGE